jgi:hypothetical protein
MYQADKTSGIAQGERMSIISRPPIRDILTTGLLRQLNAPINAPINAPVINPNIVLDVGNINFLEGGVFQVNDLPIVPPSNIVNLLYTRTLGADSEGNLSSRLGLTGPEVLEFKFNGNTPSGYSLTKPESPEFSLITFTSGSLINGVIVTITFNTSISSLTFYIE